MARKKKATSRDGRVLMKHADSGNTAWMSESTIPHHRQAGWVLADAKTDQPPAGDNGSPGEGGSHPENGENT